MAYRLGDYAVYGEIRNNKGYTTHGLIILRGEAPGQETVVRLDLTGNCDPDLQGRHFRFQPDEANGPEAVFRMEDRRGFQAHQIGPTGTMTAQGWARTLPCAIDEYIRRADLGEPPPTEWKRRLYLEWYSQNGRVVVEMGGVLVEECVREPKGEDDEEDWAPLPNLVPRPPAASNARPSCGPEITLVSLDGDGARIERWTPVVEPAPSDEDENAPVPDTLQRGLDAQAAAIDRAIGAEDAASDGLVDELKLMDYCIEHVEGEPLAWVAGDLTQLPQPEKLDDKTLESHLKVLLARMACMGVALDVCEHFTPRDCYRLLLDEILHDATVFTEIIGTGSVQHVMTHEYCADCEAEIDRIASGPEDSPPSE